MGRELQREMEVKNSTFFLQTQENYKRKIKNK